MKINSISLENYRNIESLSLDFDNVNIIYGENAQGKTNLLEAIYLFTGAKSFRGVKDKELIKFDCEKSRLKIDFTNKNREQTAEISIKERRSALLNGVKKKSPVLLGEELKAVIFSPVHLSMIKDGPSERRKFIDSALSQIKLGYRKVLKEYNRVLIHRNTILKDMAFDDSLKHMLYIWDESFAKYGAKVIYQRQKYIDALTPYVKEIFNGLSNGREEIDIKFKGDFVYENLTVKEIEEKLMIVLDNYRSADILNRVTTLGPHRDDLEILINGRSARKYGSQGQQRSCVLALKLAEASLLREKTQDEPVALLDDVMSELDEGRQDYILNHIKDWQVFITCCDANTILRLKQGKTFHIENGRVSE